VCQLRLWDGRVCANQVIHRIIELAIGTKQRPLGDEVSNPLLAECH